MPNKFKRALKITFEPKECDPNCEVADCPYSHGDVWIITDGKGNFIMSCMTDEELNEFLSKKRIGNAIP